VGSGLTQQSPRSIPWRMACGRSNFRPSSEAVKGAWSRFERDRKEGLPERLSCARTIREYETQPACFDESVDSSRATQLLHFVDDDGLAWAASARASSRFGRDPPTRQRWILEQVDGGQW